MIIYGKDLDACSGFQRADIFADATAIAYFFNQIRLLDSPLYTVKPYQRDRTGADRFIRNRAVLFTDDAVDLTGKGETVIFVEHRFADNFAFF